MTTVVILKNIFRSGEKCLQASELQTLLPLVLDGLCVAAVVIWSFATSRGTSLNSLSRAVDTPSPGHVHLESFALLDSEPLQREKKRKKKRKEKKNPDGSLCSYLLNTADGPGL